MKSMFQNIQSRLCSLTTRYEEVGSRILFLDTLRAIAVLFVVWGHIFIVGISDPTTVSIWIPGIQGPAFGPNTAQHNIHGIIGAAMGVYGGINPGALGVTLFFIISGFVIVRTVERTNPLIFIVQRFFRIVPACFVTVTLVASLTYLYCSHYGLNQPNTIESVLTSAVALNYFNSSFSTIPVLWTLEIEMFFYIVMSIAAAMSKRISYGVLLTLSVICFSIVLAYASPLSGTLSASGADILKHFAIIFVHMSYMLIGSVIYRGYSERRFGPAGFYLAVSLIIYLLCYKIFAVATDHSWIGANARSSLLALVIFFITLFIGASSRAFTPLHRVARISYPLYLVHVPIGWAILYWMADIGLGMHTSALASTIAVIFIAWILHHTVELPSQRTGKRIGAFLSSQKSRNIAPEQRNQIG